MIEFFSYLLLLLIPIVLILIVRLKRRQRIVYSHTFLKSYQDERLRDFLFRTFQLYNDVLFDLLLAVVLALFLAQALTFTTNRTAVCIDGSYSMVGGQGDSPLARAVSLLPEMDSSGRSPHFYVLAFDPAKAESRLYRRRDLERFVSRKEADSSTSIERVVDRLIEEHTFFNIDLRILQDLYDRGYGRVIFLTDRLSRTDTNLEVVEVGEAAKSFFWPASLYYDHSSGTFQALIIRSSHRGAITVMVFDEQLERYRVAPFYEQRLPGSDLGLIEIPAEGLYRFRSSGLDFLYHLEKPTIPVTAEGEYSRIVVDVLPHLVEVTSGERPAALLADITYEGQGERNLRTQIRSFGKHRRKLITLLSQNSEQGIPLIHPLNRTLSQPAYAELPRAAARIGGESIHILFQDPLRTLDQLTPIAYLSYLEEEGTGIDASRGGIASAQHSGLTSFAYIQRDELIPLNLSAEEFFPVPRQQNLVFSRRQYNPLAYFIILLAIYLTKLTVLVYFRPISKG